MVHGYGVDFESNDYLVFSSFLNEIYHWLNQSRDVESILCSDMRNDEFWKMGLPQFKGGGGHDEQLVDTIVVVSKGSVVGWGRREWTVVWEGDVNEYGNWKGKGEIKKQGFFISFSFFHSHSRSRPLPTTTVHSLLPHPTTLPLITTTLVSTNCSS